jgi:hypothetical protein
MNRTFVVVLCAFLGALFSFVTALPSARSAPPVAVAQADARGEVPLAWIAEAMAGMPFVLPAGR